MVSQGDANRSYSEEDQSSSNIEEFDKLHEGLDSSGGKGLRSSPRRPGLLPRDLGGAKGAASGFPSSQGSGTVHSLGFVVYIYNGKKC